MDAIIKSFNAEKNSSTEIFEFEAQIGIGSTKMDYNNVIEWLLMAGFKLSDPKGLDIMRVIYNRGSHSIRIEMTGIGPIQQYCRTRQLISPTFIRKERLSQHKIPDYSTNLGLSKETTLESFPDDSGSITSYRLMNRVRLTSSKYKSFVFDCSIVRTNTSMEALLTSPPSYEIEAEFINTNGKTKTLHIIEAITLVSRGLQQSNYPISNSEKNAVISNYSKVTTTREFIGPRSITLQEEHLHGEDNIYNGDYLVTEKADGERKMLFITNKKLYFLLAQGKTMGVEFTGQGVRDESLDNTIIDGEHVTRDKHGMRINSYVAFDIYFQIGKDTRSLVFGNDRISAMESIIKQVLKHNAIIPNFILAVKSFHVVTRKSCEDILAKTKAPDGYSYHTDGLIFTPRFLGVGMTEKGEQVHNTYMTWTKSLKWKPAEENTIDFKIQFDDKELYEPGISARAYKFVRLNVGFSRRDIDSNPSHSISQGYDVRMPRSGAVLFKPSNPLIPGSHLAKVYSKDGNIFTEKNEILEQNMIVECYYDDGWKLMRVRWDKMRHQNPNAFSTAANNWYTIHHPITEGDLTTAQPVSDVHKQYYAEKSRSIRRSGLQIFHNEVKRILLSSVIKDGYSVIDFAIGLGGDLSKMSNASFILGIDIDAHNILSKNGACSRYIQMKSQQRKFTARGVFIQGDSSLPIKTGNGIVREYDKSIVRTIFGLDSKQPALGAGIEDHYGKGRAGFDVSSMQFAIHYMFKNINTLTQFISNIAQCTKLNGHFVGTCYDGQRVFDTLQVKSPLTISSDESPLCTITKKYTDSAVVMDNTCLGYTIDVLQSIIGVTHQEWLVFFPYFIAVMQSYGFEEVEIVDFKTMYKQVPNTMTDGERQLSFLNRTFKFKKVREVLVVVKHELITI